MESIGKGLTAAVVCDGDGSMAPGSRLLDDGLGIGQGIHITHGRVQMQLHTLLTLLEVFAFGHLAGHNGEGLQHGLVGVIIHQELALDFQNCTVFHTLQDGFRFLIFQETANTDR